MSTTWQVGDVGVVVDDHVATVELRRPPNNFFDVELIRSLADAYTRLSESGDCRAIVLCSQGKHFCAGANLTGDSDSRPAPADAVASAGPSALYAEAIRLFEAELPVVAAVHGAAVGGGLGLACSADFRVAAPDARFSANFARLGFHHGFALSATLPAIVGQQRALELLYTGRRISGEDAHAIGLCDRLAPAESVRAVARELAAEIAGSAPLAVRSIRRTQRSELLERVRDAVEREAAEQMWLRATADFAEGVRASAERRTPQFRGE